MLANFYVLYKLINFILKYIATLNNGFSYLFALHYIDIVYSVHHFNTSRSSLTSLSLKPRFLWIIIIF